MSTLVVGPGRAGRALALLHAQSGDETFLVGRSEGEWQAWATAHGIRPFVGFETGSAQTMRVAFAVSDSALEEVAMEAVSHFDGIAEKTVIHVSGIHGLSPLSSFSTLGAATGVLHPLLPFPENPSEAGLAGSLATLLASDQDKEKLLSWADTLGFEVIPFESEGNRAAYHLGLSLAANHVVASVGWAEKLLTPSLGPRAREAVLGLARVALDSVGNVGAAEALTGPVVRGEEETIAAHLAALDSSERGRYAGLLENVIALAESSGRLSAERAHRLRHIIRVSP